DAGSIEGQVAYAGPDPDLAIPLTADPTCAKLRTTPLETEKIVGDGAGHLGNVFVYVKAGLPPRTYPAPTEKVELDQSGCAYLPRVVGVRVGQPLVLKNSDSTIHNVFAQAGANPQFNQGLPYAGMSFEKVFEAPQVMMTLKCNVHPWMTAYVGVVDHPYFAVTGPDGKFAIPNLPPGTYTLEAWHESLGVREAVVTVEKGKAATAVVDFGVRG
ncbi:MAG TPA: carboxypeptidase regulatory-like domain-containing protein, partial [Thermoanaerobaculia bacterium]|nr:carboxypeptidase regulatory-like domain-containing protein [Thermoanaerobaculia bacterium]